MVKKWVLSMAILLSLGVAACNGNVTASEPTLKVAVSSPLGLDVGQDILNGVKLALAEAKGRAGNIRVELLVLNSSDPPTGVPTVEREHELVTQAIADGAVIAYIGPATSDQVRESLPLLNQAGITQITYSATWPGLTKPGFAPGEPGIYYPTGRRNFFRTVPSDDVQGVAAARWAARLGIETVYIVDDGSSFGQGVAGIFEINALDQGLKVVAHDSYDAYGSVSPQEYAALAAQVVEAQPDLVYYGGPALPGGSEFIGAVRKLNPMLQIMGPDGLVQEEIATRNGPELVEGIYATHISIPANQLESAAALLASYRATYGNEPTPIVVSSYEAMKVLLYAIEQAKEPTREGILTAMSSLGEFSGALGRWHFDPNGDISLTTISGMQLQNGQWSLVEIIK